MKPRYTKVLLIVFLSFGNLVAQKQIFKKGECTILSDDNLPTAFIDTIFKGKQCLKLDSRNQSIAFLDGINAKNFRVEMDIAGQQICGLGFAAKDGFNYQFIYFRPAMGNSQEAIQYIPIYNGALSWVFYNYPVYETTADIKQSEWFHAAYEVRGNNLKVFVNDDPEPKMDINILENEVSGDKLLLRSMFGPSYFANVTYKPLPATTEKNALERKSDFLTTWEISEQFPRDSVSGYMNQILKKAKAKGDWKKINEPEDAYVNFTRYFEHPNGVLVAKTTLDSNTKERRKLYFDFVGKIRILLNGKELFDYGKIKFERAFDGTFAIGLDLEKGNNELIVIAEGDASFFGKGFKYLGRYQHTNWGFIARLD